MLIPCLRHPARARVVVGVRAEAYQSYGHFPMLIVPVAWPPAEVALAV